MTMQSVRITSLLSICLIGLLAEPVAAQTRSSVSIEGKSPTVRQLDPDQGTESRENAELEGGSVAGTGDCETVGAFTTQFQFSSRYRGNLYSINDNGVFLKEIKMALAFSGTANLYVSVHRKLPDDSYIELDINPSNPTANYIIIVNAPGLGATTSAYYSSGLLANGAGIELTPGEYAIGFSWGPESIKYGRDAGVTYPREFEVGMILSSVSRELIAGEPPLDDVILSLTEFAGGVYAQQLCFVPTEGACCLAATQTCVNVLEADCVGAGSFFHGQRTTCKDTICDFGACCFECDNANGGFAAKCGDNYVADSCTAAGGINFWTGVSCPADDSLLCPKRVGACCNGTTCNLKCETECLSGGGTYEGDGTNCDPNTHKCKGACCVTGGCLDRTQAGCTGSNGTFKGRGTRCFSETCGGACCYGFSPTSLDFCEVFNERELCTYDPNGGFEYIAYRGDGTECEDGDGESLCGNLAQYKACCLPDGSCMNTTQGVCTAPWIQGNFVSTGTCDTIPSDQCTNLLSRCCFPNGTCEVITGNACQARGGAPVVGQTTCSPSACTSFAGACCGTAAGACTMATATQCLAQGGTYQGDNSDCSAPATTCPSYGACCRGNGDCLNGQTPAQCTNVGGSFQGAGSTCSSPAVDCETRGACCAVTGTCLRTTSGTCAGISGEFKGVGTQCAPGVCISGACCLPEGCIERTPQACDLDGGIYRGTDVACTPQLCTIEGGCCRAGACTVETPDECAVGAGTYLGSGTDCGEGACVQGACCRINGTCSENSLSGGCEGDGEVFHAGLACSAVTCTASGACCEDTNCTVTTEAQCTGVYQGDGQDCGIDTCSPTGACCNGASCSEATQIACGLGGGIYKGDESVCEASTCAPTGACCVGETCTTTTEAACGGTYQGNGVLCEVGTCQTTELCTAITASVPDNCAIDARRPFNPLTPGTPEGWNSVQLTFNCDTAGHTPAHYAVSVHATGTPPAAPTISSVTPNGTTATLNLSGPIPPGAWTCFSYVPSGLTRCFGFLPADVNSGRTSAPADILDIVDNLNNVRPTPLVQHQCDIDRSGVCLPPDIITQIDMLNGASGFAIWNGSTLPLCPSAP